MVDEINSGFRQSRSYGQFCALARALDVVGERWSLLIVRELLPGPMRYTELKRSLAGIASNLLADRLKALEANGVVERRLGDAGVVYTLTPWGAGLREPMEALGRWGSPLLATGRNNDAFQPRWLALAIPALLQGATSTPAVECGIETDGLRMVVRVDETGPSVVVRPDQLPDTLFTADPDIIVGLAAGQLTVDEALGMGTVTGERRTLSAVFGGNR